MSIYRSRKEEMEYKRYRRGLNNDYCQFCEIKKGHKQYVSETKSLKVIKNIFPYSMWDGQRVVDHLMILPKKHIDNLGELSAGQAHELLGVIDKYEKKGYNIYARAPASKIKTVIHQHTHLIKTQGSAAKLLFLIRWPFYMRIPK